MRLSCLYLTFASLLFFNLEHLLIPSVSAQITPDITLPNNSSVNNQDNVSTITGGTQAGNNLFHSFEQFSIPTGGAAYFNNIGSIQNIISRVTGGSISNIDGLLRANGTANLFLLNSNGIVFGPNASLNIGGSFLGSTASSIKFTDDTEFNAKTFQDKPLLSVNVPVGLNFTGNQGSINVKSTGHTQLVNATSIASFTQAGSGPGQSPNGLRLQPSKTIALIGGNVTFDGGVITAPSGWIEVGSIDSGLVKLTLTSARINFSYEAVNSFQDIQLVKQSLLDASGEFFGDIHIQGKNITFTDGSLALIANLKRFNPGAIRIDATETLDMTGITSFNVQPSLGTLKIVRGLNTATTSGKGADIIISAKRVIGQGSGAISPVAFGFGDSGDLIINSAESVEILGGATNETSGIGTVFGTITYGAGKAGNVTLSTKRVHLNNGGTLQSLTFGKGRAGEVTVNASELLKISGGQAHQLILRRTSNGLPDVANAIPAFSPSSILSQSLSSGDAGDIDVKTSQLTIENGGRLAASALVSGGSGNIKIDALNAVDVIGSGSVNQSLNPSTISSSVGTIDPYLNFIYSIRQAPTGSTGSIKISTGSLSLRNGGQVTVRNDGIGKGGELQINANSVQLDNQAGITASTQSGQGGNIKVNSRDLLLMRRNSQISTSAGNAQAGGDGGQINIDTKFLVAPPLENSDITANAFLGKGGNVNITASAIFGLVPRSREELQTLLGTDNPNELDSGRLPTNDITAISQTNPSLSGNLTIVTPDVDPSSGLVELPSELTDISNLIAQGCSGTVRAGSKFIITGRGGLPEDPSKPLNGEILWTDLSFITPTQNQPSSPPATDTTQPNDSAAEPLIEASGWAMNPKGEVVLTAATPSATVQVPWLNSSSCHA